MRRKFNKTSGKSHIPVRTTTNKLPAPPAHCTGFIYTVQKGDTLFFIAQRNKLSLNQIIAANPQIPNPNNIFPGQRICVPRGKPMPPHPHPPHPHPPHPHPPHPHPPCPHPPHPHPPGPPVGEVVVEFLGRDRKPLPVVQGVVQLARHTIVRAKFPMHIDEAFLFFTPASRPFEETILIEAKRVHKSNTVEFNWEVPANTRGTVFIIGCDGSVCRRSRDFRVS